MKYEQLSLFPDSSDSILSTEQESIISDHSKNETIISEKITDAFDINDIPFLGCDFELVYPLLAHIIPKENTSFLNFDFNGAIVCEIICSAICHQMNWDFLRKTIYDKTIENPQWIMADYLSKISEKEIYEMFSSYSKTDKIRAYERMNIIRDVGKWLLSFEDASSVFLDKKGQLLTKDEVRKNLLQCKAFRTDPEEKKLQLLLQKLSSYNRLKGLAKYYEPAIDYHLIRSYLRRGLVFTKTKYAKEYICNYDVKRKESTVAAVRQWCAKLLVEICSFTDLDIVTVNQIEWHIGRSVCVQDRPDCLLEMPDSQWLKPVYKNCPFYNTCVAANYNRELLQLNEPLYKGPSY